MVLPYIDMDPPQVYMCSPSWNPLPPPSPSHPSGSSQCTSPEQEHVWLFVTPWSRVRQTPLSVAFSRQEYWNGSPFHTPGDLPYPRIKPVSLASPALAGRFFTNCATWEPLYNSHQWSEQHNIYLKVQSAWKRLWNFFFLFICFSSLSK